MPTDPSHFLFSLGVRQKIGDLQASYNAACDWKKHTGEGILAQDEINGVKTVEGELFPTIIDFIILVAD
jgi:hypothetical protein